MRPYTEIHALAPFLLEESYVLDIEAHPSSISFKMDLVLTPDHPSYAAPVPGEQHCYRRGTICFRNVERLLWVNQGAPPARDATGELDFGGVDQFEFDELGFLIEGSWGRIELRASEVDAALDDIE